MLPHGLRGLASAPVSSDKKAPGLASIAQAAASPQDAPDMLPGLEPDSADPRKSIEDFSPLPPDCPVQALGKYGKLYYFMDDIGQLVEVSSQFTKGDVYSLFGNDPSRAEQIFPQYGPPVKDLNGDAVTDDRGKPLFSIKGLDQTKAQKGLIRACSWAGIFDPNTRVRGRGAHLGRDGEIILHCGGELLVGPTIGLRGQRKASRYVSTGLIDGSVYPAGPKLPKPATEASSIGEATETLLLLRQWNWRAPDVMPEILLGFIGAALIPGALPWRPHLWLNASSGAGKTTLMNVIEYHMGDWLLRVENATEAGIRQTLGHDALSVLVDEFEAEASDDTKAKVLGLARISSSGGTAVRGSSEHKGQQFTAKSCFLFSSILHQPLISQDRNRITVLDALALPQGAKEPIIVPELLRVRGASMRRRMVEQWPRFAATYDRYRMEIQREGFSARHGSQYGVLLTCADMLLYDEAPHSLDIGDVGHDDGRVKRHVAALLPIIMQAEVDGESDHVRCLRTLTTHRLPAASGQEQESVGRWIVKALAPADGPDDTHAHRAMQKLKTYGLRLVNAKPPESQGKRWGIEREFSTYKFVYLAVSTAKENKGLGEIFDRTDWKGGVWSQSLNRVKGKDPARDGEAIGRVMVRYDGNPESSTLVPLHLLLEWEQRERPPFEPIWK